MIFKKLTSQFVLLSAVASFTGCSTAGFKTTQKVDLARFMGPWHVAAGRFTMFEKEVHNAVEAYSYDEKSKTIKIDFSYRKGSTQGPLKKIPQTGEVVEGTNNAHWLVSPLWPFKFDYLIVDLAEDYSWVAVGVPSQKYLWIMFRKNNPVPEDVAPVVSRLNKIGYDTSNLVYVPQDWSN